MAELTLQDVKDKGIALSAAEERLVTAALQPDDHRAGMVAKPETSRNLRVLAVVEQAVARSEADRKLLANERLKSTAGFMNSLAGTVFSTGIATPAVGSLFVTPYANHVGQLYLLGGGCFVAAVLLHWLNRWLLGGLQA